jgi:hypothetical protein
MNPLYYLLLLSLALLPTISLYQIQPLPTPILINSDSLYIPLTQYFIGTNLSFSFEPEQPDKLITQNKTNTGYIGPITTSKIMTDLLANWIVPGSIAILAGNNTIYISNVTESDVFPTFLPAFSYQIPGNLTCFGVALVSSTSVIVDCEDSQKNYFYFVNWTNSSAQPTVQNYTLA